MCDDECGCVGSGSGSGSCSGTSALEREALGVWTRYCYCTLVSDL